MAYFVPPARYTVLVVTDSRGVDMLGWLDDWGDIELDIVPAPSTGIEAAIEVLITLRRDATPNMVIVMNGICDVLTKNRVTHKYFMVQETVADVVKHYMAQVKRGQELLEIFFDNSLWMFNPLTGADISGYNSPERKGLTGEALAVFHANCAPDPLQSVMDQAVLIINTEVGKVNRINKVFTPYTASFVHRHYDKSYHHSYHHTRDGCHLTQEGKKYWATQLVKAIGKTRAQQQAQLLTPDKSVN